MSESSKSQQQRDEAFDQAVLKFFEEAKADGIPLEAAKLQAEAMIRRAYGHQIVSIVPDSKDRGQ